MDTGTLSGLQALLQSVPESEWRPRLFDLSRPEDQSGFAELLASNQVLEARDNLAEAIEDLFRIDFPFIAPGSPEFAKTFQQYQEAYVAGCDLESAGIWAYFSWKRTLVHLPTAEQYFRLRTARNKFLITPEEQEAFYAATIGVAGLSAGSSVLSTTILSGGGRNWQIADFDTLAITNLNRLPASVCELGISKSINSARRAYETDPFLELTLFSQGFEESKMDEFFHRDGKKIDLYFEEMDNIRLKIVSRFRARELGIPVVMVTDNGDNTIIDVERFDQEPGRPLFHGRVDEEKLRNTSANLTLAEKVRLADAIAGQDVTPRMQASLQMVGTKLPSWPQLGNAATLSGVVASYVARRIITGAHMPSGRYDVHLDRDLDVDYGTESAVKERAWRKQEFIDGFNLLYGKG